MTEAPAPMFPLDLEGAPKIVLAGKEWPIPKLAPKQSRHVTPAMMKIIPLVSKVQSAVTVGKHNKIKVDERLMMSAMASIDEASFDAVATCVFWAIKRGHPQISQAEFDEMPIDLPEMLNALPVIMRQIGFIKLKAPGDETAGEGTAAGR